MGKHKSGKKRGEREIEGEGERGHFEHLCRRNQASPVRASIPNQGSGQRAQTTNPFSFSYSHKTTYSRIRYVYTQIGIGINKMGMIKKNETRK